MKGEGIVLGRPFSVLMDRNLTSPQLKTDTAVTPSGSSKLMQESVPNPVVACNRIMDGTSLTQTKPYGAYRAQGF